MAQLISHQSSVISHQLSDKSDNLKSEIPALPAGRRRLKSEIWQSGFTLIEILIALTITSLVFVGGYTGYRDFVRREALNNAYSELNSNLNLAKQRALSGEKPQPCLNTETFRGHQMVFDNTTYTLSALCDSKSFVVKEIRLPPDITVSGPTVLFKPLGQGTNLDSTGTITIRQISTGSTKEATLDKEGSIQLK